MNTADLSCPAVQLSYSWVRSGRQEPEYAAYEVQLTTTPQRFGGVRWWFLCPLLVFGRPCDRRVGKLYLPGDGRYFGCRQCHELTYTSCQESHKYDRLYRDMARSTGEDFEKVKRLMNRFGKRRE